MPVRRGAAPIGASGKKGFAAVLSNAQPARAHLVTDFRNKIGTDRAFAALQRGRQLLGVLLPCGGQRRDEGGAGSTYGASLPIVVQWTL